MSVLASNSMDPQQIRNLAEQLSTQFVAMRQQRVNHQESSLGSHANPSNTNVATNQSFNQGTNEAIQRASSENSIVELATQLGGLMDQRNDTLSQAEVQTVLPTDKYASVPDPSIFEKEFTDVFHRVNASVLGYEDTQLLETACEQLPIDKLFEEAESMAKEFPDDNTDDIVIRYAKTTAIGHVAPTAQERQDGAGVVEIYKCTQSCEVTTRFPRYGGMSKILFTTRRGRCGEWANCFTVCCRALGYRARFVHDTTDHVWTEVWSEHKQRWIHCDACEAAYDQPLLYTTGWGKSLSYCIAFSAEDVVDVTKRYTTDYDATVLKRRRSIREPVLAKFLHGLSESNLARLKLDSADTQALRQRQALEADELSCKKGDTRAIPTQDRQSGSDEWTKARGERR
ncbi:hypothetical protein BGX27_011180 [Mortierella sp. AM989]|nr:hypothetical protein BGX27_011180 [Mortierella sp. AM989]